MMRCILFGVAALGACLAPAAQAQTAPQGPKTTEAAKAEGKAFGREQAAAAQQAATTRPDAERIPNFSNAPAETRYFDDPAHMERKGARQANGDTGYRTMRDSMERRARFAPEDLDGVIARSARISADPMSYTSGLAVTGAAGRCVPLPPGSSGGARYMATCNVGYTAREDSLAIDTVCPECSKIMQEFAQKAQLMNNLNINSCEMAQGLVGGIWPKGDLADKAICEAIGNSEGIFTDYAAAKHGCGTRGQRASTTAQGAGKYDDVNPGVARNYTWTILKKSAFFSPGGTFDRELAEYAMTLLGTIIYIPPTDDQPGKFVPIAGDASSTLVTSLLDGTSGSNVLIYDCDEPDKCLDPGFKPLSLSASKALRPRVSALIAGMVDAIREDTPITEAQKELLQVASIPLYKILTVQAAYGRGMPTDDRETLAEIASVDLLFAVLDRIVSESGRSMSSFIGADEAKIAMWQGQVNVVRQALADRQANTHLKVGAIMQIIEKTAFIENVLAASISPGMSASLDWSRGVQSRALSQ